MSRQGCRRSDMSYIARSAATTTEAPMTAKIAAAVSLT
jgi:hypothetical protein